jgi:hypothetical protein
MKENTNSKLLLSLFIMNISVQMHKDRSERDKLNYKSQKGSVGDAGQWRRGSLLFGSMYFLTI